MVELKDWVVWLRSKGLAERSIKNYYFYYKKFDWDNLNQRTIVAFLTKYRNDVARAFIKNTIQFLLTSDMPESYKSTIRTITIPKVTGRKKSREPEIISLEDVEVISNAMTSERNKLMVLVNFYAGLRVAELVNIKPYDFKWDLWDKSCRAYNRFVKGELKIIGKGNKGRTVLLPGRLMDRIKKWIKSGVSAKQSKEDPLFNIKVRRYQVLLSKASVKSIDKKIHPHILRGSCATYLLEHGLNVMDVRDFLGHKTISTTQKYLKVNQKKLGNKYEKAFG